MRFAINFVNFLIFVSTITFFVVAGDPIKNGASNSNNNNTLIPLKYKVKLKFVLETEPAESATALVVPGAFEITAKAVEASNVILVLWNVENFSTAGKVNVTNLTKNKILPVLNLTKYEQSYLEDDQIVNILLEDTFQVGDELLLQFHHEPPANSSFKPLRVTKSLEADGSNNVIIGQYDVDFFEFFMPLLNCKERKNVRLPVEFSIGLGGIWKNSHKILSIFDQDENGKKESLEDDIKWTHFKESSPVEVWRVGFFISEFTNYTTTNPNTTTVSIWGSPGVMNQTENGMAQNPFFSNITFLTLTLLANYERKFGLKYPLDDLHIILRKEELESPKSEQSRLGQLFLSESYPEDFISSDITATDRQTIKQTLSQQLAHQFSALLADPLRWKDLRSYVRYRSEEGLIPQDYYVPNALNKWEELLSAEIVRDGIKIYWDKHAFQRDSSNGHVFYEDLQESIFKHNASSLLPPGVKVKDISVQDQKISASLLPENNHIQLTLDGDADRWLPIGVKISLENSPVNLEVEDTFWIAPNTTSHNITKVGAQKLSNSTTINWFLLNKNYNALYDCVYDKKFLSLLAVQLKRNHSVFSPAERYSILLQNQFTSDGPMENQFILTDYFAQETDQKIWSIVFFNLLQFRFLLWGNDDGFMELRKHFVPKIESYLKNRGGLNNIKYSEERLKISFQFCLLLHVPSCLQHAVENLEELEASQNPNSKYWVMAAGSDPKGFKYLQQAFYNQSNTKESRLRYFNALSWTQNDTEFKSFIESAIENGQEDFIFEMDNPSEFRIVTESRLALLTDFAMNKLNDKKISATMYAKIAKHVLNVYMESGYVASPDKFQELKKFIKEHERIIGPKDYSSLENIANTVEKNIDDPDGLWNKKGKLLLEWLKKFNQGLENAL